MCHVIRAHTPITRHETLVDHAKALVQKAENDLKAAEIGFKHESPLDTVAFHLQQSAEKLIKAFLTSRAIAYPRTHDLEDLLDFVPSDLPEIHSFREQLLGWNSYAVQMRYEVDVYPEKDERKLVRPLKACMPIAATSKGSQSGR